MKYDKITSYSIKIKPSSHEYLLKLKLLSFEEPYELSFSSIHELSSIADLLRNEMNTFFDKDSEEIIITWEPTGENDPKYDKHFR